MHVTTSNKSRRHGNLSIRSTWVARVAHGNQRKAQYTCGGSCEDSQASSTMATYDLLAIAAGMRLNPFLPLAFQKDEKTPSS